MKIAYGKNELSPGAGTGGRRVGSNTRNHAGVLLALMLLVPLGARCASPDRAFVNRLADHLSLKLPGLTADALSLSVTPTCPVEQVELRTIQNTVFGTSLLTLRCGGSRSLPFTATLAARLAQPGPKPRSVVALRSGSAIRLEIQAQGVAIITKGTALASGAVGDIIPVRAARTNRVLRAQVVDGSTVRAGVLQ